MRVVFSQIRNFMVIAFNDANMHATSIAHFNGTTQCFKIVGSGSKGLTPCTCLCYLAVRLSKALIKTRTQRGQAIHTYLRPASKTSVNKKIYLLSHPAQTRKRTKKQLPNSYIKVLNYRQPIVRFLQKTRAWSRSDSLQPFTTLVQITQYTSPNYTDNPQVNIRCI